MRFFVLWLFLSCTHMVFGQDSIESYSYVSDEIVEQTYGLPIVRSVGGGTKIVVEYQGNWHEDMKGAFEYACKIWEENMEGTEKVRLSEHSQSLLNTKADCISRCLGFAICFFGFFIWAYKRYYMLC